MEIGKHPDRLSRSSGPPVSIPSMTGGAAEVAETKNHHGDTEDTEMHGELTAISVHLRVSVVPAALPPAISEGLPQS